MTTDPQTARDNLIGYCLVASPNEVTLERAERLADAYRDAVLAVPSAPVDRAALERVRAVLETEAVVGRSALEYRGLIASALMAVEKQQPETQAREETGSALARYIADRPVSEIQAAIRILGWPPLRFDLVEDEAVQSDTDEAHSCAESGCTGEPAAVAQPGKEPQS